MKTTYFALVRKGDSGSMENIVFLEPNKIDSEPFITSKVIAEMTGIEYRKLSVYQIQNQRDSVAVL